VRDRSQRSVATRVAHKVRSYNSAAIS